MKAKEFFREAYENFTKIAHLKGKYLAKHHEANCLEPQDSFNGR